MQTKLFAHFLIVYNFSTIELREHLAKSLELVSRQFDLVVCEHSLKCRLGHQALSLGVRLLLCQMPIDILPFVDQLFTESFLQEALRLTQCWACQIRRLSPIQLGYKGALFSKRIYFANLLYRISFFFKERKRALPVLLVFKQVVYVVRIFVCKLLFDHKMIAQAICDWAARLISLVETRCGLKAHAVRQLIGLLVFVGWTKFCMSNSVSLFYLDFFYTLIDAV